MTRRLALVAAATAAVWIASVYAWDRIAHQGEGWDVP